MRPTFWTVAYGAATALEFSQQGRAVWIIVGLAAMALSLRRREGI